MTKRCHHCRKKKGLLLVACPACEKKFCTQHVQFHEHECPQVEMYTERQKKEDEDREFTGQFEGRVQMDWGSAGAC